MCDEKTTSTEQGFDLRQDVMTTDSNAGKAVLRKQFDLIKKEIKSNSSRTTAVWTFEPDDQHRHTCHCAEYS